MNPHAKKRIQVLEAYIRQTAYKTSEELVADTSFYSYRHANRLFKLLKGESINSYANKIRIQVAAEYLKYSTKSALEIALLVGYESTAALSKAFKRLYGQSPMAFRKATEQEQQIWMEQEQWPPYQVIHLPQKRLLIQGSSLSSRPTLEEYFNNTRTAFEQLSAAKSEFLLLWDDDPELSQVAETPYQIAIEIPDSSKNSIPEKSTLIEGKYAYFEATDLMDYDYEFWHTLAYLILGSEGVELRDAPYTEWFSVAALSAQDLFIPHRIGIAIR